MSAKLFCMLYTGGLGASMELVTLVCSCQDTCRNSALAETSELVDPDVSRTVEHLDDLALTLQNCV